MFNWLSKITDNVQNSTNFSPTYCNNYTTCGLYPNSLQSYCDLCKLIPFYEIFNNHFFYPGPFYKC